MIYSFLLFVLSTLCLAGHENTQIKLADHQLFTFEIVDAQTENKETVIHEVLELQNSLIIDNQTTIELPPLSQDYGFLTVRTSACALMSTLQEEGKILTARHNGQLVGYLILTELGHYFSWIRKEAVKIEINSSWNLDELEDYYSNNNIKILEQISVNHFYAKQGIGSHFIKMAKELSPKGLSTDILNKPFTNKASFSFFAKQGFVHMAKIHVLGRPPKCIPHEIWVELWRPDP